MPPLCRVMLAVGCVLALLGPVGADAQTTPRIKALVLQSQTPWVGRGGVFELRLAAPPEVNVAAADLEYAVSVHPSSPTRSAFANTLTNRPTTAPLAVVTTGVGEALTDETGSVTLDVGVQDPAQPRDRTRVGLRGAGVYPVAVELRSIGGAVHARLLTHLIFVPETPTGPKLAIGVVVPLRAPLALQPDGTTRLDTAARSAITSAARTLAALPSPGVLLAPSPETLAALARVGGDDDAAALEAARAIAANHATVDAPFVPTQQSAATVADRETSRERGTALIAALLAPVDLADVAIVTDSSDDRLSDTALPQRLIVTDSVLTPATQRVTVAEPITIRRSRDRATAPALLADTGLGAHLRNGDPPVLAAHHLLADLATVYFDSPGRFRSIAVLPPASWRPSAGVLGPLLAGLASSPILEAAPLSRLFQLASTRTVPRTRTLAAAAAATPSTAFASVQRTVGSLRRVMQDAADERQNLNDRLLIAESTLLESSARATYVAKLATAVADERHKFQLPQGGSVTLTARRGAIPITVRSSANYDAQVLLQVASDRLKFPGGTTRLIQLTRNNTTASFTVQALGSGAFPLRILLKSPDGKVVLSQSRLTVRSSDVSGVGVALSGGALLFLVVWWYRHSRARRRVRAAAQES